MTPAPRILVVSGEQWPRALLRAQLDEAGYDAIGAGTLSRALRYPPDDAERGPVRLIVLDSGVAAAELAAVEDARRRYPGVAFVLVHGAGAVPPGPWAATLQRPVTIGDIVATVRRLVPLARLSN
jgi:DNA-binding NtrC family response regulator